MPADREATDTVRPDVVGAVLGLPLFFLPDVLLVTFTGPPESTEQAFLSFLAGCAAVFALAGLRRLPLRWGRGTPGRTVWQYTLFLPLWFAVGWQLYQWIAEGLGGGVGLQSHLEYFMEADAGRPAFWFMVVTVALVGPLAEEIVFRGWIQTGLAALAGRAAGLVATSALFGVVHGLDKAVPVALLGVFFGWLRDRTGGLCAPWLAHAVHNGVVVSVAALFPDFVRGLYT